MSAKKCFGLAAMVLFFWGLTGCAASSTSPIGVNCDYSKGKALGDMPLDCQGR